MNSVAKACTLNNQGVESLVSGNTAKAMARFRGALKILKLATDELASLPRMTAAFPFSTRSQSNSAASTLQIATNEAALPGNERSYVYDHGLMIVEQDILKNGCRDAAVARYTAVVLFNWALAFHREGRRGHGDAAYLDNALDLYKTRMLIPQGRSGTIGESKDATSSFLTVAALNNMAQIYFDRLRYAESLTCMDQVARILDEAEDLEESLAHMDMEVIFLNTLLLHKPTVAHAA